MLYDIIGWVGSIITVVAYYLLSTKRMKPGLTYQLLNLVSALFIAIGVYPRNAWFSFALQIVWGAIAIIAIVKLKKQKKCTRRKK